MNDAHIRNLLQELHEAGQRNDEETQERSQKMLNLEPDTAHFLYLLLRSSQRKHILEIGTSNGYSTIWLAWVAAQNGGHVISIDQNEQKHVLADSNLRKAELRDVVNLIVGDASAIVTKLPGPFDCVFFDADRISAPQQLSLLVPKLTTGAIVLADNVISHPQEIAGYLAAIHAMPQFDHMVVPIGKGLSMAFYKG
jgi:predicted O-methyltransferase YrrM